MQTCESGISQHGGDTHSLHVQSRWLYKGTSKIVNNEGSDTEGDAVLAQGAHYQHLLEVTELTLPITYKYILHRSKKAPGWWIIPNPNRIKQKGEKPQQTWESRFFRFDTREPELPLFRILFKRFHDALETRQLLQYGDIVPASVDQPTGTRVFHLLFFIKNLQTAKTSQHFSLKKPADIPKSAQLGGKSIIFIIILLV